MYWLGLIGFLGTFLDIPVLRLFYLFFLLAIVDFVLSFIIVIRTESTDETAIALKFLSQNIGMLIGIPVIYVRNLFFLQRAPPFRDARPRRETDTDLPQRGNTPQARADTPSASRGNGDIRVRPSSARYWHRRETKFRHTRPAPRAPGDGPAERRNREESCESAPELESRDIPPVGSPAAEVLLRHGA